MNKRILIITLFFIIFCNYNFAGAFNMDFKTYNLENGVKVKYTYRNSIPIVYITVLIPASPLDEAKPSQAYLTAQLLTHGTKSRSAKDIEDAIDFLAISIEKKVTADFTALTLSTTKRHLKEAVALFFDILKNPTFPEEEFKKELSILENSLRQMDKEPSYIAGKKFLKALFGEHPYGRPVEGEAELLKDLKREDIVNFYEKFYKPDKMIFSIIGDLTESEMEELLETHIKSWEGKSPDRAIFAPKSIKREKPLEVFVKRDDLTQSTIVLGFEGISRKDQDYYAFSVMNYLLGGGGLTSRLARSIREEQGLAYSIYSIFSPYLMPGDFHIEVKTKTENTKKVIQMIVKEIEKIKKEGVTEEELKEAKSFLIGSFPLRIDTMKKISEFLCVVEFYGLGDDYVAKYPEYIERVTKEDIKRGAERFLNTDSYIVVVVGKNL